jgi:hypothetical protein
MVVLAASVVTKTGKGEMNENIARKRTFLRLFSFAILTSCVCCLACSSGVSPVCGHEQNQNRGTSRSVSQADRCREAAYLCRSRERAVFIPAFGGKELISQLVSS